MAKQDEFVMPMHFKRFLSSTQDWSDEEVGCYLRLLIQQWQKESIPDNIFRLKRISDSVEKNYWIVEKKFKKIKDGLQNEDMEIIRNEQIQFRKSQKERRVRWEEKKKKDDEKYKKNGISDIHSDKSSDVKADVSSDAD